MIFHFRSVAFYDNDHRPTKFSKRDYNVAINLMTETNIRHHSIIPKLC